MDRYIKVDDVLNIIDAEREQYRTHNLPDSASKVALRKVSEAILELDAIDIVRCAECKKAHLTYGGDCKYCDEWKDADDIYIEVYHDGNHYCSYGERRTDNE
jgi:hypothetical protein